MNVVALKLGHGSSVTSETELRETVSPLNPIVMVIILE